MLSTIVGYKIKILGGRNNIKSNWQYILLLVTILHLRVQKGLVQLIKRIRFNKTAL